MLRDTSNIRFDVHTNKIIVTEHLFVCFHGINSEINRPSNFSIFSNGFVDTGYIQGRLFYSNESMLNLLSESGLHCWFNVPSSVYDMRERT